MESSSQSRDIRSRLKSVRDTLLDLHKALLDAERTSYELVHGTLPSPAAFLQLLINDNRFAWLRPITTQLVQIDEGLAAKNPARDDRQLWQLLTDTQALLSPSRGGDSEFWKRYSAVLARDPGVAVLQHAIEQNWDSVVTKDTHAL